MISLLYFVAFAAVFFRQSMTKNSAFSPIIRSPSCPGNFLEESSWDPVCPTCDKHLLPSSNSHDDDDNKGKSGVADAHTDKTFFLSLSLFDSLSLILSHTQDQG